MIKLSAKTALSIIDGESVNLEQVINDKVKEIDKILSATVQNVFNAEIYGENCKPFGQTHKVIYHESLFRHFVTIYENMLKLNVHLLSELNNDFAEKSIKKQLRKVIKSEWKNYFKEPF